MDGRPLILSVVLGELVGQAASGPMTNGKDVNRSAADHESARGPCGPWTTWFRPDIYFASLMQWRKWYPGDHPILNLQAGYSAEVSGR